MSSQQIVAQELRVEIKEKEITRAQANGSVRREITLSKEQESAYQRVRELISHSHPNPSFAEVFEYLTQEFLKRKDPLIAKGRTKKKIETDQHRTNTEPLTETGADTGADQYQMELNPQPGPEQHWPTSRCRSYIPIETMRFVHRRDQSCRWKSEHTGEVCESKFQLQADHIRSLWAGGSDEPDKLQLLCSHHNRLKYRREAGIRQV